jgi:hypothetical protein
MAEVEETPAPAMPVSAKVSAAAPTVAAPESAGPSTAEAAKSAELVPKSNILATTVAADDVSFTKPDVPLTLKTPTPTKNPAAVLSVDLSDSPRESAASPDSATVPPEPQAVHVRTPDSFAEEMCETATDAKTTLRSEEKFADFDEAAFARTIQAEPADLPFFDASGTLAESASFDAVDKPGPHPTFAVAQPEPVSPATPDETPSPMLKNSPQEASAAATSAATPPSPAPPPPPPPPAPAPAPALSSTVELQALQDATVVSASLPPRAFPSLADRADPDMERLKALHTRRLSRRRSSPASSSNSLSSFTFEDNVGSSSSQTHAPGFQKDANTPSPTPSSTDHSLSGIDALHSAHTVELQSIRRNHIENIKRIAEERDALATRLTENEGRAGSSKELKQIANLTTSLRAARIRTADLQSENERLQEQNKQLLLRIQAGKTMDAESSAYEGIIGELVDAKMQYATMQEEMEQLRRNSRDAAQSIAVLTEANGDLEKSRAEWVVQCADLQRTNNELQRQRATSNVTTFLPSQLRPKSMPASTRGSGGIPGSLSRSLSHQSEDDGMTGVPLN